MTGQSPYDMARLLDEFPEVFDAYRDRAVGLAAGRGRKAESFSRRREATRAERIRKAARRR